VDDGAGSSILFRGWITSGERYWVTFGEQRSSGLEFAQVVCELALQYPEADTIHLVMDNLNIHRRKSLTVAFGVETGSEIWDRFTVHHTPTHGSWLNQAEIEIGMFSRQMPSRTFAVGQL
jgi:hypothetical protein